MERWTIGVKRENRIVTYACKNPDHKPIKEVAKYLRYRMWGVFISVQKVGSHKNFKYDYLENVF